MRPRSETPSISNSECHDWLSESLESDTNVEDESDLEGLMEHSLKHCRRHLRYLIRPQKLTLFFNPKPKTLSVLFSSPSLPNPPPPFLQTHNLLSFLRLPLSNSLLLFFPTGPNSDRPGFLLLSIKASRFDIWGAKDDDVLHESTGRSRTSNYNAGFRGTKLPVSWDAEADSGNCKWLSCEFSWHPRILIVARSDAVFLVDLRFDGCAVSCLAKVEVLRMYTSVQNERFLMFTMARGSDGFCFSLASDSLLVLCDVQKPMMPLLQWTHGLDNPCDINNCEFNLFCYGPTLPTLRGSIISEVLKTHYAWELPSDLLLSGRECQCGSCLVREEILKDDLPEWIDWQHKKELALGFAILNKDLSAMLSELNEFGGFTLIRLISLNHKASVPCGS
ncbi:hypothetical protein CFP56_023608 [Quercus suber]|uniref:Uncharacterized protein n=1 Tax=Quercus suber TaxID=58331 RepID=A0AAW0K8X4_QUESU